MSFEITRSEVLVQYRLKSPLSIDLADSLAQDLKKQFETDPNFDAVVFDFQNYDIEPRYLKPLTVVGMELRKLAKQMYAISKKKAVHSLLKQEGLSTIFKPIFSLDQIETSVRAKSEPLKLDVSFINPFIDATIHVLKVQCQTEATADKPLIKGQTASPLDTEISGVLNVTSAAYSGSIAICFPSKVFLKLISRMLGEEFTEITKDIEDGAAEILNMVFGHAKTILNQAGHTFERALPSVVRGSEPIVANTKTHTLIVLPFSSDAADFHMEFTTDQTA